MNAFLTGSQVYGTPTEQSDVDIVLRVTDGTADLLRKFAGCKEGEPIRFGKLNIIICITDIEFSMWRIGTEQLLAKAFHGQSQDKAAAKALLDGLRESLNLYDSGRDSGGYVTEEQNFQQGALQG